MSIWNKCRIASALAILLTSCGGEKEKDIQIETRPHVLLITATDLALEDLSVYDGPVATPNLERLAQMGTVFEKAYSAATQNGPARAAMMTGRYPQRIGFDYDIGNPRDSKEEFTGVPVEVTMLPEKLQDYGYDPMLVGSWQLGAATKFTPLRQGFKFFWGTLGSTTTYAPPRSSETVFAQTPNYRLNPSKASYNAIVTGSQMKRIDISKYYLTDATGLQANNAINGFLEEQQRENAVREGIANSTSDKRLFLWASFHAPGEPLTALKTDVAPYGAFRTPARRAYAGMIAALDRNVGLLLDTLEENGMLEETLILFTSDRGCSALAGTCPCGTLRGGAGTFREGGLRVPLIIAWPGKFAGNTRMDVPTIGMDVFSTILDAADLSDRLVIDNDGESLFPAMAGRLGKLKKRDLFWEAMPLVAMLSGDTKLLLDGTSALAELYDLSRDPSETDNFGETDRFTVAEMETRIDVWQQFNTSPLWDGPRTEKVQICEQEEIMLKPR